MYVPPAPPRLSILHRPQRAEGGQANVESAEREYAKEQARIAAKQAKQASHEERLVGAYYPLPEDKRRGWEQAQQEAARQAAAKAQAEQRERQREEQWLSQPKFVFIDSQRPYHATCSTYYMPVEQEAEARRRAQREAAEVNRRMQQVRSLQEQQQRATEQVAAHRTLQAEETWFNRGAASERWLPPELRVHRRVEPPPHLAFAPPPYYAEDAASVAGCSTASTTNTIPPAARPSSTGAGFGHSSGARGAAPAAARPATAPASAAPPRANPCRLREGEGARAALSHDIAFEREASAHTRQAAARAAVREKSYPWSWGAA
eukprot:scaffold4.g4842.t1